MWLDYALGLIDAQFQFKMAKCVPDLRPNWGPVEIGDGGMLGDLINRDWLYEPF